MRIVFAGTPDFAVPTLEALMGSEHTVLAVYTQPDRPKGRGRVMASSPVKVTAEAAGIPVMQPLNFRDPGDVHRLRALDPDYLVVVAYGLLLSEEVLSIPKQGAINVHASLLPRWRGASPIQQSILAGDAQTGVTIMKMVKKLDAGDILYQVSCPIEAGDTSQSLQDKLAVLGSETLLRYLKEPEKFPAKQQDEISVSYAGKINKQDAVLDWNKAAAVLEREVRAYHPWPISQVNWQGETLRIWQARCCPEKRKAQPGEVVFVNKQGISVATGEGLLVIEKLQKPGAKPVVVADFLNANPGEISVGVLFQ